MIKVFFFNKMKSVMISTNLTHWRSSHYAITYVRNENSNILGRSTNVVKVIYHTIRSCS